VELVTAREHDEGDLSITEDGELLSFLDKTIPPFGVGDLPVRLVLDPLDLDLPTTHLSSPKRFSLWGEQIAGGVGFEGKESREDEKEVSISGSWV
jgi:hypothetical protein